MEVVDHGVAWRQFKHLSGKYLASNPFETTVGVLTLLSVPSQELLIPHVTGKVVNAFNAAGGLGGKNQSGGGGAKAAGCSSRRTGCLIALLVGAVALTQGLMWVSEVVDADMFPKFQNYVREVMLRNIVSARTHAASNGGDTSVGDTVTRLLRAPLAMAELLDFIKSTIPHLLVLAGSVIYVGFYDRWLGLILLASSGLMITAVVRNLHSCKNRSVTRDHSLTEVQKRVDDVVSNLTAVVGADTCGVEIEGLSGLGDQYRKDYYSSVMCMTKVKALMIVTAMGLYTAVLLRCWRLVLRDAIKIGTFVAIMAVCLHTLISTLRILHWGKYMIHIWGSIALSYNLFEEKRASQQQGSLETEKGRDRTSTPTPEKGDVVLEAKDVVYSLPGHQEGKVVLNGVSLAVRRGERVAIVGMIGSGKTTLLNVLAGQVARESRSVWTHPGAALLYVPQRPVLFDRSVYDNIVYGVPEGEAPAHAAIEGMAESLGLDSMIKSLPHGLQSSAGRNGTSLSGGQRQAVWIMRMMVAAEQANKRGSTVILLLDEPTASLDSKSSATVCNALVRFPADALIFVTHDDAVVTQLATRAVHMEGGKVAKDTDESHEHPLMPLTSL